MDMRELSLSRSTDPIFRSARKISACPPLSTDKIWNVSTNMICLSLAVLLWNSGNPGYATQTVQAAEVSTSDDLQSDHVVTGTLEQLDFSTGKGLLKTDLDKPVFFEMAKPELFRRLSVGQRVTIGMNEQGQAVKVMEIPPVELPHPPAVKK